MKRALLLVLLSLLVYVTQAQQSTPPPPPKPKDPDVDIQVDGYVPDKGPPDTNKVYFEVEHYPEFPGGINSFYQYLAQNLHYPVEAVKNRIEGRVFIGFVVERDGSLTGVKILRGLSHDIDTEAVRVIKTSPKWKPGIQGGIAVRTQYTIPVSFKLPPRAATDSLASLDDPNKTFTAVEHEPTFPGGMAMLYKYLMANLRYPEKAVSDRLQGKVFVSFVVEKDGTLIDIKVIRSLSPETDAEALRLMRACPKWNPGVQNGKPVRVMYSLPINFDLPDK